MNAALTESFLVFPQTQINESALETLYKIKLTNSEYTLVLLYSF